MAFTEFVPGMKPGNIARNLLVAFIYLLFFYLIPFVLAYAVFTNRNGIADKLSGIPGISNNGGGVSALAIFLISIVAIGVITAALPTDEAPSTDQAPASDGASTETNGANDGGSDENGGSSGDASDGGDSSEGSSTDDGGQSEEATESDVSADEQEQQVQDADESDTEGTGVATAESDLEDRDLSDDELIPVFETLVENEGMSVETAEMQGDTFVVEYMSFSTTEQDLATEMGYVAGAYAGMVAEGHTSDRMEVVILNVAGERAGTFHVEYEWAEAYANDEITADEFSLRVLSTLQSEGQARIEGGENIAIA